MILLDTHTFVWWVTHPEKLSSLAKKAIQHQKEIGISVISCWEISMLVSKGRLGFSIDVGEWITKSLSIPEVKSTELTPEIAVLSTRLPGNPPEDPSDRFIIATALTLNCPVVTKDEKIRKYPHCKSIW